MFVFDFLIERLKPTLNMLDELQKIKELKGKTIDPKYKKWTIPTQEKDTNPLMVVSNGWN